MNQDEVESQLSAMFDGELPSAECELLSRRVDRDDRLRARWSRYAMIGAAMRCEPVATARSDFASRVSRALDVAAGAQPAAAPRSGRRVPARFLWQGALAASLVGVVAGLSLVMLRTVALQSGAVAAQRPASAGTAVLARRAAPDAGLSVLVAGARAHDAAVAAGPRAVAVHEPFSYTTPANAGTDPAGLRTELVDYIVAHSEYSTPLVRPDLLSAVISGEDAANDDSQGPGGRTGAGSGNASVAVEADAPAAVSTNGR